METTESLLLTRVTRQGFRDHTGGDIMVAHASGYFEYTKGFVDVMENGKILLPPLNRIGIVDRKEKTVRNFLLSFPSFLRESETADEAKEKFFRFLTWSLAAAPRYPDITSTHFAAQIVSDRYYRG